MSDFQIYDSMLWKEARDLAQEIFEDVKQRNTGETAESLRDDMMDQAHERADGHEWIIYGHKALMLCAHCATSMGDEFLSNTGMPQDPDLYNIASAIAYGELRGRIEEELQTLIDAEEASECDTEEEESE